jgi:hypothetical protein
LIMTNIGRMRGSGPGLQGQIGFSCAARGRGGQGRDGAIATTDESGGDTRLLRETIYQQTFMLT